MESTILIEIQCWKCKEMHKIEVPMEGWQQYKAGESHVQDLFPDLSAPLREMFISRTCPTCQKKVFRKAE